jgi:hypothetical protein
MLCRETLDGSLEFPGINVTRFAQAQKEAEPFNHNISAAAAHH